VLRAACAALNPLIAELIMLDISVPYVPRQPGWQTSKWAPAGENASGYRDVIGLLK